MNIEITLKPALAKWVQSNSVFCEALAQAAKGICDERWKLLNGISNEYDLACGIDQKLNDGGDSGIKFLEGIKHSILTGSSDEKAAVIQSLLLASEARVKSVAESKMDRSTLVKCPECGHDVSLKASICPHCGLPVKEMTDAIRIDYEYAGVFDCPLTEHRKNLLAMLMMDAVSHPVRSVAHENEMRFIGALFKNMPIPFFYRWINKIIGIVVAVMAFGSFCLIDYFIKLPDSVYWVLSVLFIGLWYLLTLCFYPQEIGTQLYYCEKVHELLLDLKRYHHVIICHGKALPVGIEKNMRRQIYDLIYAYFRDRDIKQMAELKTEIFCYFFKGVVEIRYSPDQAGKILFQDK